MKKSDRATLLAVFVFLAMCPAIISLKATKPVKAAAPFATLNVNSLSDNLTPPAGTVTLRSAIETANASGGSDTINLTVAGTYQISVAGAGEDANATGDLDILSSGGDLIINNTSGGSVTIDATGVDRAFDVCPTGGTPINVQISNVTIKGSLPNDGGGLKVGTGANLTLIGCTITGCSTNNDAGGILVDGGTLTMTNCTVSGNSVPFLGGGIKNSSGTLNLTSCTISNNSGTTIGNRGQGIVSEGTTNIRNTIIAGNNTGSTTADVEGSFTSQGYNIIGALGTTMITPATGDQFTVTTAQVNLGALQNNGGSTSTHALISPSIAIDQGNSFSLTSDQRGSMRPCDDPGVTNATGGDGSDVGAFELQSNCASACVLTCPANITTSTAPNQCGANVTFQDPTTTGTCGTVTCSPSSGSFFNKGITTVNCSSSIGSASCSFTVTVNDTQSPSVTCLASVTAVSAVACPPTMSTVVNFPAPTASDNCPGVTVACVPPSGSTLPAGTTTVTCTATDTSGNTASCSFPVTVFNGRLQDDSNPKNVIVFNTMTGAYILCCGGTTFTGTGSVILKGCLFTLQHNPLDRRLLVNADFSQKKGTASLQFPPGVIKCTITDRNMADDTSTCP